MKTNYPRVQSERNMVGETKKINLPTDNKPYFTKYLQVEGEIKEGDMVKTMGEEMELYHEGKMRNNKSAYQLYKLFLCSRDIQVGDKYWSEITNSFQECKTETDKIIIDVVKSKRLYKVIGEISPDALSYVKEGDEFDESDTEAWHCNSRGLKRPIRKDLRHTNITQPGSLSGYIFYKIRGKCGHFH